MSSPSNSNDRKTKEKTGWLTNNATLIAAIVAFLAALITAIVGFRGVIYTQEVATENAREGLKAQQDLEDGRAREAELQTYLDDMGKLLLDKDSPLPKAEPDGAMSSLARAKTLTILERLDGKRKRIVLQFLAESQLIRQKNPVISLDSADLSGIDLSYAFLKETNLSNAATLYQANLHYAHLNRSDLSNADLEQADLSGAFLSGAFLNDAYLSGINMSNADLEKADLSGAQLSGTDLSNATLYDTDLSGADMSGASLSITQQELEQQAFSLEGATMSDGSKHD